LAPRFALVIAFLHSLHVATLTFFSPSLAGLNVSLARSRLSTGTGHDSPVTTLPPQSHKSSSAGGARFLDLGVLIFFATAAALIFDFGNLFLGVHFWEPRFLSTKKMETQWVRIWAYFDDDPVDHIVWLEHPQYLRLDDIHSISKLTYRDLKTCLPSFKKWPIHKEMDPDEALEHGQWCDDPFEQDIFPIYMVEASTKSLGFLNFDNAADEIRSTLIHPSERTRMERILTGTNNPVLDLVHTLNYHPAFMLDKDVQEAAAHFETSKKRSCPDDE